MCSPKAPAQPDYTGAAVAQGAANLDAARASAKLSNPNIIGPYGEQRVSYGTGAEQDIPTITQTLTPTGQSTVEAQQQAQLQLAQLGQQGATNAQGVLGTQYAPTGAAAQDIQTSFGSPGNVQSSVDTSGLARMPVDAGMTGQQAILSRLNPQMEADDKALRQRLANQGLTAGGEAYNNEMRVQGNKNNDLVTQAALQGIGLDTQARQQGFNELQTQAGLNNAGVAQQYNQNLGTAQFGNTAQQGALQQQLALRQQPLNEIAGLLSGSQIDLPQFQSYQGQNVQAAPIYNAAVQTGQGNMQNYGINTAANNNTMSGLFGLGAAGVRAAYA